MARRSAAKSRKTTSDSFDFIEETGVKYEHLEVLPVEISSLPDAASYPENIKSQLNRALHLLGTGDICGAITHYEDLYKQNPKDSDIANLLAALLLRQKDFVSSKRVLKKILKAEPKNVIALTNLASCHIQEFDYSKNVEKMLMKALELSPAVAQIHHNAGVFYHRQNKIQQALKGYRNAKLIAPMPETLIGLGFVSKSVEKMEEAKSFFNEALKLSPRNHQAYLGLAGIEMTQDNPNRAFMFAAKAVNIAPTDYVSIHYFVNVITNLSNYFFSNDIMQAVVHTLSYPNCVHKYLFPIWQMYLSAHKDFIGFFKLYDQDFDQLTAKQEKEICDITRQRIFWLGVKRFSLTNHKLEAIFTKVRKYLLQNPEKLTNFSEDFLCALASNCFFSEYVFNETPEETKLIEKLEKTIKDSNYSRSAIALLGCYRALYQTEVCDFALSLVKDSANSEYAELIKVQIEEPREEQAIKKTIQSIGNIENETSRAVKDQYEHNPYPRWQNDIDMRESERRLRQKTKPRKAEQILVAGCGTGKQTVQAKIVLHPYAHFTSVDLSSASLAYAIRKSREYDLRDIKYFLGDILELEALGKTYDKILCTGVLHHMKDPMAGWQVLTNILKPGGTMHIALYSELARQDVVAARKYIQEQGLSTSTTDIRKFREYIKSLPDNHELSALRKNRRDFYTTSMCRDLCFHVQEHRFTIPQIKDCLDTLGLKFVQFVPGPDFRAKLRHFPEMKNETDLDVWEKFEEKETDTFKAMYQFICQKPL